MNRLHSFRKSLLSVSESRYHRIIRILGLCIKIRSGKLMARRVDILENTVNNLQSKLIQVENALRNTLKLQAEIRQLNNRITISERKTMYAVHKYSPEEKHAEILSDWYFKHTGKVLNLKNPQTYNEKIQWMKLYDSIAIKTKLADKYLVRDWVAAKVGAKYLIPLLGVWDSFDDIDFESLPNRFVLKCNHGCGYNLIVKDKSQLNLAEAKRKINTWLGEDFAFRGLELHYSPIPRKIIAEEYIENTGSEGGDLYDYKFWCFDGKVKYIQFLSERNTNGLKMAFYDMEWNKQNFVYSFPLDTKEISKPDNLVEMIEIAEKLAAPFNHVRVDLYRMDDGKLYFGEMTFTTASGNCKWVPDEMDYKMGQMIRLPQQQD